MNTVDDGARITYDPAVPELSRTICRIARHRPMVPHRAFDRLSMIDAGFGLLGMAIVPSARDGLAVVDTNLQLSGLLWREMPHALIEQVRAGALTLISSLALLAELAGSSVVRSSGRSWSAPIPTPSRCWVN